MQVYLHRYALEVRDEALRKSNKEVGREKGGKRRR